jgi:hypothetical protein
MSNTTPTSEERADRLARRTKVAIGVVGGLIMVVIALQRRDLAAGTVGYGFVAMALVEAEDHPTFRMLALIAATGFVLYMITNSLIVFRGGFDLPMALPALLTPLLASWAAEGLRRRISAR